VPFTWSSFCSVRWPSRGWRSESKRAHRTFFEGSF
jgi:hypothetical protein